MKALRNPVNIIIMDRILYKTNEEIKNFRRSEESNTFKPLLENIFVKIGLIAISFFLFYNIYHSIIITSEKLKISKKANEEVSKLRVENLRLGLELENMKSSEFLEVQARDRLNLSSSGEYIFIIDKNLLNSAKESLRVYLGEDDSVSNTSSFEAWRKFFIDGV